ncbi:polysaccharide biosynthesis tyrosine autokinase [Altererythrobacter indicus]|uniref:non-specific protein-tyrosine kinase n=1 Tax=Altericroceibacterium indicum TaxID=374177 RepID=A0A845ABG9_9SPHN|nr:polysaccharide biosynthesis tyrosine autokinase [Altericroceibacterium indicum]MXP27034.1 polysaccharide biosynthesis tyrosine autokinase [Altericroceibacterium indicum]
MQNDTRYLTAEKANGASISLDDETSAGDESSLIDIDFSKIFSALRRNILWIIAIIVGFLLAGLLITMLIVPQYVASSRVLVEQEADQIIEGTDLAPTATYQDTERFLQTQVDIIGSRSLALRVVQSEGLSDDPTFFTAQGEDIPSKSDLNGRYKGADGLSALRRDEAVGLLQKNLSTSLPANSRVISINFKSADPVVSARIANAIADNYIAGNLNRKFDSSAYARKFLAQQLEEVRAKLADSETKLNQYSSAAGLIRTSNNGPNGSEDTALSVTNNSLVQVNAAASQAVAARIAAENAWRSIEKLPVLSVPQVLSNQAVQNLIAQRSQAEAQLAEERARHLDDHPTVLALKAQVDRLNSQIQDVGKSIKQSVYSEYKSALDQENALTAQVNKLRSDALIEQDRGVQYNVLKREAETNRSLYDTLLERYNSLNASAGAASNNVSIVDRAEVPSKPSSPKLTLNLALAFVFGVAAAAVFVFLREYLDDIIRSPDDVERKLGLPLLGLVPNIEDNALDLASNDGTSSISEAYQSMVTNLSYATATGLPKSIQITSSQPSEGKTTTSNVMAVKLARLGQKTLLIDGDLRRPTLHRLMGEKEQPGLSSVLAGQSKLQDVIRSSEEPNLSYMTALPIPPDPSLLLGSPRLGAIMDELKEQFDVIVVDCPPMLGLADAISWSTQADAVLMVVDASQGHRGAVKASLRRLRLVGAPVIGIALTKFDPKAAGGDYGYYGYRYYNYTDETGGKG